MAHIQILLYTPRRAGVVQSGRLLWRRKKPSWVDWCSRNLGQTGHKEWEPLQSSHSLHRILFTYIWYAQQPHYLFASSSSSRVLNLRVFSFNIDTEKYIPISGVDNTMQCINRYSKSGRLKGKRGKHILRYSSQLCQYWRPPSKCIPDPDKILTTFHFANDWKVVSWVNDVKEVLDVIMLLLLIVSMCRL